MSNAPRRKNSGPTSCAGAVTLSNGMEQCIAETGSGSGNLAQVRPCAGGSLAVDRFSTGCTRETELSAFLFRPPAADPFADSSVSVELPTDIGVARARVAFPAAVGAASTEMEPPCIGTKRLPTYFAHRAGTIGNAAMVAGMAGRSTGNMASTSPGLTLLTSRAESSTRSAPDRLSAADGLPSYLPSTLPRSRHAREPATFAFPSARPVGRHGHVPWPLHVHQ